MSNVMRKLSLIIAIFSLSVGAVMAQGPAAKPMASQRAFTKETIYFLLPTRFFDGDPTNNRPNEWCSYDGKRVGITDPEDVTWRGDFKGLMQQLDYIQGMGFTTIWITPVVQNAGPLDYHGYHAYDFTKVDPRLESPGATFQDLINAVHARGMKIVLDIVTNHSGRYGIKGKAELKYNTDPAQPWGQKSDGTPLTMPATNGWQYDGMTPNPEDGKIWSRANIPAMPAPYNSNLVLYNWPCTEAFVNTSDENWFHHSGNGFAQGWDDTENLYNRALAGDCPDLNTESQAVRDYLVAAYTKFINMGIDGIRWDTMKHMDRSTVLYFRDAFAAVNPNLFIFGETAQKRHDLHSVESINPHWYTWRGAVGSSENSGVAQIDFFAEGTFHNVFQEGASFSQAQACARYDNLYSDPYTNLTWLDNHDFGPNNDWNQRYGGSEENLAACMNFMFTWRGIPIVYYGTEIQFMKGAYTDLHNASDIEESLDKTGRAYYGKNLLPDKINTTKSHKIYQQIRKLNQMRSQIPALWDGDFQWGGNAPGNAIGFTRVKGSSKVCVGLAKDGGASFSFTGIDNGTWVDAVTGKSVTVTNGTLGFSCSSGSAGVYVLNGPGMIGEGGLGYFDAAVGPQAPMLSVAPGGGTYPATQSVTLTGTPSGVTIRYTTDGSTPTTTTGTIYTGPITVATTNTTIKAIAYNGTGASAVLSNTYYIVVPKPVVAISPASGKYPDPFSVSMTATSANPPVSIRYTTDGSTPTSTTGTIYTAPITISNNTVVKAIAIDSKLTSDVVTNTYTIGLDMPVVTISPTSKTYVNGTSNSVTLTVAPINAQTKIYYTTDGSTPTASSAVYSSAISITGTDEVKNVKAIAVDKFAQSSAVVTGTYTFAPQPAGLVVYFKKPSTWSSTVKIHYWNCVPSSVAATTWPGVSMTDDGDGWYKYTILGATSASIVFNDGNGKQTGNLTRNTEGYYDGNTSTWSDTRGSNVSVSISPASTNFTTPINVTLSASGTNTPITIRYTLDGSTPTASTGTVYTGPITISGSTKTVKAIAVDNLGTVSSVASNTYTYSTGPVALKIHVRVTGSSSAPYLYAWTGTSTAINGAWPGTVISGSADADGYYTYTFAESVTAVNIIINKGSGQPQTSDILNVTTETWYTWSGANNTAPAVDVVTALGSMKAKNSNDFVMEPYPNPFNNSIKFKLNEQDVKVDVRLFDIQGVEMVADEVYTIDGSVELNADVPKGIYILRVVTENASHTRRVVKK